MTHEETGEERTCPCCGEVLPLGLFSEIAVVQQPAAIEIMARSNVIDETVDHTKSLVRVAGRRFLSAPVFLPLGMENSPVRAMVWVEVKDDVVQAIKHAPVNGPGIWANGTLACDIPGFPGSIGSDVEILFKPGEPRPYLMAISDERISSLPESPTHEQLIRLYRLMFGSSAQVAGEDLELRYAIRAHWERSIGRLGYRSPMKPPAALAGIMPTEAMIFPPVDTGSEAAIATIGCSEQALKGEPAELICWARNPSDEFIERFGNLGYLSRLTDEPIQHGLVIGSVEPLPGTQKMRNWMICEPWWEEDVTKITDPRLYAIKMLAAVPVFDIEAGIAAGLGADALIEEFQRRDIDVFDLGRDPAIEAPTI